MLSPSAIGWIVALALTPIGAAFARALRKPKSPGTVQRYSPIAAVLALLLGVGFLAGTVVFSVSGWGWLTGWRFAVALTLLIAMTAVTLFYAYYYAVYYIVVTPDEVLVNLPMKGKKKISRENLIEANKIYWKGWYMDVKYRDGDAVRHVRFDLNRFDLRAFFDDAV